MPTVKYHQITMNVGPQKVSNVCSMVNGYWQQYNNTTVRAKTKCKHNKVKNIITFCRRSRRRRLIRLISSQAALPPPPRPRDQQSNNSCAPLAPPPAARAPSPPTAARKPPATRRLGTAARSRRFCSGSDWCRRTDRRLSCHTSTATARTSSR